jgi:putative aldouronate transport system substrate-binding protein
MKVKKMIALLTAGAISASVLTGCGNAQSGDVANGEGTSKTEIADNSGDELPDVELWNCMTGLPVEKDSPLYNLYKEKIGVGIVQPYVEWNGGSTYQQQLNLKISAGEMPDIFYPVNGMEVNLIKNGALLDLTDILPEKAPHLWESIPEEVWDIIRTYDPTGEGRIYGIPNVRDMSLYAGLIRQDWLDKLGLEMPTTQEEFVEVLRAFKNDDPNGNGLQDEIPTGGRQEVKWMDQLFAMYGIAMQEGSPDWDVYDGELTYSAVTPNMKDALAFISELYKEGLVDPETLLNDKAAWEGKINSDRVGVCFHWAESAATFAESMKAATGTEPEWAVLPAISAPGYEGFYTEKQCIGFQWVVKNTDDEATIDAIMKVLDACGNKDLWLDFYYGVDGMHSETVDGKREKKPEDPSTQQNMVLKPWDNLIDLDFKIQLIEETKTDDRAWALDQAVCAMKEAQKYGKVVAGDGMPTSIYDGYADILNKTLYVEYASKIIVGEYDIDKFDEFVERWYASGGEEVTQAARAWYASEQK